MELRDILGGSVIEVWEREGSEYVQPGDVIFGCAVSVDGVGMLIGTGTTLIPPGRKTDIIQFRKQLRDDGSPVTDVILHEWDREIRHLYFHIEHSLYVPPQLCNTDGDQLELHRLVYEVSSADDAFERLCGLCVTMDSEELEADAKRDAAGRIVQAEITWDRQNNKKNFAMPNTVLGRIMINDRRLIAKVNSSERADALRHKIDEMLGGFGQFKVDEIQDVESMMREDTAETTEREESKEHEEWMRRPEVQEQLADIMWRHWENWVDQKLPALSGKTPRDAVKTADGLESVEALLHEAERDQGQDPLTMEANRKGVQRARELLGFEGANSNAMSLT